ncbi:MAG: hypothetical protein K2W95_30725 [Candidatus Obscuribacterales bacterium]|nr:hypothetical protein [Candidatus Obscuribacterales bacterium]
MSILKKAANLLAKLKKQKETAPEEEEVTVPCCSETVHIAFRGVADDKLYMARNRKWTEVRFYKQNGLRVFCATCRHRVL